MTQANEKLLRGCIHRIRESAGFTVVDMVCECGEWVRGIVRDGLGRTCGNCNAEWGYRTVPVDLPRLVRTEAPQGAML